MIIKRIFLENIRSYKKEEIKFPEGAILLAGDIGTGKSSVLLSIEFALFGLQPGQRGSSLLRYGEDYGKVILEFNIEGKDVIIERTLKRNKKSVSQDYASIIIDKEKFEGNVSEIKNKVLKLLNYPSEFSKKTNLLYKFTVYTPQEEMKQIILEPGDTRLNTLRHVFGIDKYKRIEENASLITSRLREKIRIYESRYSDLEKIKEELSQIKTNLVELKEKKIKIEKELERISSHRKEKEREVEKVEKEIEKKKLLQNELEKSQMLVLEKTRQIQSLDNQQKRLIEEIQDIKKITFNQEEFQNLNSQIELQENKIEELQKEFIQLISSINTEETKKKEAESLEHKISVLTKCPTCLQEVSETYKNNILKKINEELLSFQKKIEELSKRKEEVSEKLNGAKKKKEELLKRKSELEILKVKLENLKEKEKRSEEIKKQKDLLNQDIELLKKHIATTQNLISEYEKYDSLYLQRKKELEEVKAEENQYTIKDVEIKKEIQFLEKLIEEKREIIKEKEKLKEKTNKIKEIEDWISKKFIELMLFVEKQVMITLREEFSKLFSKWFSVLISDTLSARLDDNFSPIIEQQDYELDYSYLSGGERTAVALAYRLALNQIINSLLSRIKTRDLIILDEPTDGFSEQQLDKMGEILNQLNVRQLILVSHEQKIENFVDNTIHFKKENGITSVKLYK